MDEFAVLGKAIPSPNHNDILTGKARYTADFEAPGMLYGKLLYSPHACAQITRLDVSKARAMPGVHAVLTHAEIPGENSYLYFLDDQPLLAVDRINYVGDAVVALAAETEEQAEAALAAIEVEYEPITGVHDPLVAMEKNAPEALPGWENVIHHTNFAMGDVQAGFKAADVIVENTYTTQRIEHAYLEIEAALAYYDIDGTLVVIASNQAPHRDRESTLR